MKMGNCIVLSILRTKPRAAKAIKQSKFVHIVEMDGTIIELKRPTTVSIFLENFPGFSLSISPNSTQLLPPSYEMEAGNTYYLNPIRKPEEKQNVTRIKVVITKQQLQELLDQKRSVEDVLLGLKVKSFYSRDNCSNSIYLKKNTKLESIPEEIE